MSILGHRRLGHNAVLIIGVNLYIGDDLVRSSLVDRYNDFVSYSLPNIRVYGQISERRPRLFDRNI